MDESLATGGTLGVPLDGGGGGGEGAGASAPDQGGGSSDGAHLEVASEARIIIPAVDYVYRFCKNIVPRAVDGAPVATDINSFPQEQIALAGKFRDVITPYADYQGLYNCNIYNLFFGFSLSPPGQLMGHVVFLPDRQGNYTVLCYTMTQSDSRVGVLQGYSNVESFVSSLDLTTVAEGHPLHRVVQAMRCINVTDAEFNARWSRCKVKDISHLETPELDQSFKPVKVTKTNDHCYFPVISRVISDIVDLYKTYHLDVSSNFVYTENERMSRSKIAFRYCKFACVALRELVRELFRDTHDNIRQVEIFDFSRWTNFMCIKKDLRIMAADRDFMLLIVKVDEVISRLFFMSRLCLLFKTSVKFWTGRGTRGGRISSGQHSDDETTAFSFKNPSDFDSDDEDGVAVFEIKETLNEFFQKLGAEIKEYAGTFLLGVYATGGLAPIDVSSNILMALQVITIIKDYSREHEQCVFTVRFFPDFLVKVLPNHGFNEYINHCKAFLKCLPSAVWNSVPERSVACNFEHYCEFMSGAVPENKPELLDVFSVCKNILTMAGKTVTQGDFIREGLAFMQSTQFEAIFKAGVRALSAKTSKAGRKRNRTEQTEVSTVQGEAAETAPAETGAAEAGSVADFTGSTATAEESSQGGRQRVPSRRNTATVRQLRGVHNGEPPASNTRAGRNEAQNTDVVASRRTPRLGRLLTEIDVRPDLSAHPETRQARSRQGVNRLSINNAGTMMRAPRRFGLAIPRVAEAVNTMNSTSVNELCLEPPITVKVPDCVRGIIRNCPQDNSIVASYASALAFRILKVPGYSDTNDDLFAEIEYVNPPGVNTAQMGDVFVDLQLIADESEAPGNQRFGYNRLENGFETESFIYNINTGTRGHRGGGGGGTAVQAPGQAIQINVAGSISGGATPSIASLLRDGFVIDATSATPDVRRSHRGANVDLTVSVQHSSRAERYNLPLDLDIRVAKYNNNRLIILKLDLLPSRYDVIGPRSRTATTVDYSSDEEDNTDMGNGEDDDDDDDFIDGTSSGNAQSRSLASSSRTNTQGVAVNSVSEADRTRAKEIADREGYTIIDSVIAVVYVYDSSSHTVFVFPKKRLARSGMLCVKAVLNMCQPEDRKLSRVVYMKYTGTRPEYLYTWSIIRLYSGTRVFWARDYTVYNNVSGGFINSGLNFFEHLSSNIPGFNRNGTRFFTLFQLCPGVNVDETSELSTGHANSDITCHSNCPYGINHRMSETSTLDDYERRNTGVYPFLCTSSLSEIAMPLCKYMAHCQGRQTISESAKRFQLLDPDDPLVPHCSRPGVYTYAIEAVAGGGFKAHGVSTSSSHTRSAGIHSSSEEVEDDD